MCTLNRAIISNNLLHIYTCVIRGQKKTIYIYTQIFTNCPPNAPFLEIAPLPRGAVGTLLGNTALDGHVRSVSIGGRPITNLRFADDIDGLAGSEEELRQLVERLVKTSDDYGMEINVGKTKTMTNHPEGIINPIQVKNEKVEVVQKFIYLGATISEDGSKPEIIRRIAQATAILTKLKIIWKDKNITLKLKIRLMHSLVLSTFLYACESWTLTADIQRRIQVMEMRCFRRLLNINYIDHITNEEVKRRIRLEIGQYEEFLSTVKKRKPKWYGHVTRASGLSKTIMEGTVRGGRKRGGQRKRWEHNISEWTNLSSAETLRLAVDRSRWRKVVSKAMMAPLRPPEVMG